MSPTPDERVEHVRMALAEAGYADVATVYWDADENSVHIIRPTGSIPDEVVWRAFAVTGQPDTYCWPCWQANREVDDDADLVVCTHIRDEGASGVRLPPSGASPSEPVDDGGTR